MNNYLHFLFWHGRFNCLEHRKLYPLLKRQPFTIVCFASLPCLNQESFNLRLHHFCEIYINIAHYRTYALQSEKLRTFSSVLISKFLALLSSGDSIEKCNWKCPSVIEKFPTRFCMKMTLESYLLYHEIGWTLRFGVFGTPEPLLRAPMWTLDLSYFPH